MEKTVSIDLAERSSPLSDGCSQREPDIPEYLERVYWWAYLNPRCVRFFEQQWIVNAILWGNFSRLRDSALDTLGASISGRTLQIACVYGDFSPKLAQRLDPSGCMDVVDVAPIQLDNLRAKLGDNPQVQLHRQDASELRFADGTFDHSVLFFLLHELPADVRARALAEALRVLKPGGRLVVVDYHGPVRSHPHRYLMRPVLATLEPFALDLWRHEISEWLPEGLDPAGIEKTTYFGGLYQKVVITR